MICDSDMYEIIKLDFDEKGEKLSQEDEIIQLKEALKFATMKVAALETLIDVAEDQLCT